MQESNPFVRACAEGNIAEIKRRLDAGEDINQFDFPAYKKQEPDLTDPAILDEIREKIMEALAQETPEESAENSLNPPIETQGYTGLGAALRYHRLDVVDLLMRRKANPSLAYKVLPDAASLWDSDAIQVAVDWHFRDGLALLRERYGVSLPDNGDLLFRALPHTHYIQGFSENSPPAYLTRARALDDALIKNGLEVFDYLLDIEKLPIDARNRRGETLAFYIAARRSEGFYGDQGRVLRHVLARGANPNEEVIIDTTNDMKIVFSANAMTGMTGEEHESFEANPQTLAEKFGMINKGRRDQSALFETTPLINACYSRYFDTAQILLDDPRTDPLSTDRNGNNAFKALAEGRLDHVLGAYEDMIAAANALYARMEERVRQLHGPSKLPNPPRFN